MASTEMAWVFLAVFTIFTIILGAGLQFYQAQAAAHARSGTQGDPLQELLSRSAVIVITLLFSAGAVFFLFGAAKWVANTR
jgi:O-antigen/teichoic acid export membrane protein